MQRHLFRPSRPSRPTTRSRVAARLCVIAFAALAAAAPLAQAAFTTLGLPTRSDDIRSFSDGATYSPYIPGTQTWNGVPFELSNDATATLSALLDRLRTPLPSTVGLTPRMHGTADAVNADLDCALFAESVRVRRLLGASDVHKPVESAVTASAMWLDVPIRCLATVPRAETAAPARQALPAAANRAADSAGLLRGPATLAWLRAHSDWLLMLAASAVLMAVLGLAARARSRDQANGLQWR